MKDQSVTPQLNLDLTSLSKLLHFCCFGKVQQKAPFKPQILLLTIAEKEGGGKKKGKREKKEM